MGRIVDALVRTFLLTPGRFDRVLLAAERSVAHGALCEFVYGRNLCQFNMATDDQIDALCKDLDLGPDDDVLDCGCGIGVVTEHIAEVSGCRITGMDFAPRIIARASERVAGNDRVSFRVGDMNGIELEPASLSAIIAVDALYFVADLERTIAGFRRGLRQDGKMGLFYSQVAKKGEPHRLEPDKTPLALALKKNGLGYGVRDFTASEHDLWRKAEAGLARLESRFREEGQRKLWRMRSWEARRMVKHGSEGRTRRYLYTVHLEEQ